MTSKPTLLGLPQELFEEAVTYLSENDLKALRHVSRACAMKVGPHYAEIVHSSNRFILCDEADMRRGLMIARHRLIGPALRNIRIETSKSGDSKERKFVDRCDHAKLLTTFFDLLQGAGAAVQRLEVEESSSCRLEEQSRQTPEAGEYREVVVVLRALVKSRLSPPRLEIWGYGWNLPVREMARDSEAMRYFPQVLETVEELDLEVTLSHESSAGMHTFIKAIAAAPKLTKLDIRAEDEELSFRSSIRLLDGFRRQCYTFFSLLLRQAMPQLERFAIRGGAVNLEKIVAFLQARPQGRLQECIVINTDIKGFDKFQRPGEHPRDTVRRVLELPSR